MKKILLIIYLFSNIIFSQELTGRELAEKINNKSEPKDSKSKISMVLINIKKIEKENPK